MKLTITHIACLGTLCLLKLSLPAWSQTTAELSQPRSGRVDSVRIDSRLINWSRADGTAESNLDAIRRHTTFLATFDKGFDADLSRGDRRVYTSQDLERKKVSPGMQIADVKIAEGRGKFGSAIHFEKKTSQSLFYWGGAIGYRTENWSGTASVWMKLNPDTDLQPGYCDPLLISDKQWDRSAFFIDFDKNLPRDFRLGVFPDFQVWNPKATPWDDIAVVDRPMIVVNRPPFSRDSWTHVCFTWEGANHPAGMPGQAKLYINGGLQGTNSQNLQFSWEPKKVAMMLGIYYIGLMDELATFDRALTAEQVRTLYELPHGLAGLIPVH